MTIGERIKKLRIERGMSQDELATLVGYKSRSAVNKIELGERDIKHSQVIQFANALNTSPHYLMGWVEEPERSAPPKHESLTKDERRLLDLFRQLTPKEQGSLIGRAELLAEQHREAETEDAG